MTRIERASGEPLGLRVAEMEFQGYTPYLGGDYRTATLEDLSNGQAYFSAYPRAKQLLGRMRWLLRTALGLNGHAEAERYPQAFEFKKCPEAGGGKVRLGLTQLLFGTTKAQGGPCHWRSILRLVVYPKPGGSGKLYGRPPELSIPIDSFSKTRAKLLAMGKSGVHVETIAPYLASFRALLYLDASRLRGDNVKLLGRLNIGDLASLAVALLAVTPVIIGLGRGANRGFGRFTLTNFIINEEILHTQAVVHSVKHLPEACIASAEDCKKGVETILRELKELVRNVALKTGDTKYLHSLSVEGLKKIPDISLAVVEVVERRTNERGFAAIRDALNKIGEASTKYSWKALIYGRDKAHKRSGLNVHTWPLGLPRTQKFPGDCLSVSGRCNRGSRDLYTGYRLVRSGFDRLFIVDCDCDSDTTKKCNVKCLRPGRIHSIDGRRQSMIIAFPAPVPQRRPSNAPTRIIALLLPADDLRSLFTGEVGYRLYHSGPCNVTSATKPCATVYVDVAYAALKLSINNKNNEVKCELSSCINKKEAGFYTVRSLREGAPETLDLTSEEDYRRALEEAFNMFLEALKR